MNDLEVPPGPQAVEETIVSAQAAPDSIDSRTLIVTIFARAVKFQVEATPGSVPPFDFGDIKDSFTTLLTRLAPFIQCPTLTQTFSTQAVIRLTYTLKLLSNDPIPPINTWASISSELPANPEIRNFETSRCCETIFDLLPPSLPIPTSSNPRFRLAVFDMDSTLIDQEVIDELARSIDLTPAVSAITARAMNGEIDFATSLHERVSLLKGVRADIWASLRTDGSITIARGARELISGLKAMGVTTAVVSGGFTPMAEWLQAQLGLDYAFANHLLTAPPDDLFPYEHLSGALDVGKPLIDAQQKKDILLMLAAEHGVPVEQTIAVGDGSNDLLMMHAAGMGIAFRAKEKVQREAPRRSNGDSLEEILYLFGTGGELEHSSNDNSRS